MINQRLLKIDTKICGLLFKLNSENHALWRDNLGSTLLYKLQKVDDATTIFNSFKTIIDPRIQHCFHVSNSILSPRVIAIGSAQTISDGKKFCLDNSKELVSIPTVLSNDAFATNRIDGINGIESTIGNYPTEIIFIQELFQKVPLQIHMNGIGEVISLYSSVSDFYSFNNSIQKENLPCYYNIVNYLLNLNMKECSSVELYNNLINGLLYKAFLMRVFETNVIGAGIDHILARVLEDKFSWTHGKSCIFSLIVALLLFPEWQNDLFVPERILEQCLYLCLIEKSDIIQLRTLDFEEWAKQGLGLRLKRKTNLRNVDSAMFKKAHIEFRRY